MLLSVGEGVRIAVELLKTGLNMNTIRSLAHYAPMLSIVTLLAACGGGGGGATPPGMNPSSPPPATYTVGGTIGGLAASGLQLNLASGSVNESHSPDSGASGFTFAAELEDGDAYTVTIAQQPTGQTCSLNSASGTISSADVALTLSCSVNLLTVSGSVSGLTQGQVSLVLNKGESSTQSIVLDTGDVSFDSTFEFTNKVAYGSSFSLDVEYPVLHANQPKAICDLDTASGVAGTVDVSSLSLVCRSLGAVSDLSTVGDQGLFAVDTDINASGQAIATALNITGGTHNYLTVDEAGGSWNAPVTAGSTDALSVTPLGYHSSVLINNAGNDSLVYFDYSDLGGGSWDAQLSEKLSGAAGTTLPSNNTTTTASRMASASAILNGERVKFVAADNNDVDTPICIYTQHGDGSTAQDFCITASADMKLGAEEVNSVSIAIHVNDDGLTGRGIVAWGQDATISTFNVSRVHAARFDLDGSNLVADVIAGGNTATAAYSFKKPAVVALIDQASDEFALSYQQDSSPPALLSIDSTLATSLIASVTDGWDVRLAPELTVLSNGDLVWSYLGEDYSVGSILNGSAVTIWRARFDLNQAQDFSIDVNEARVIASEAGSLISHQAVSVDPSDNVLVSFRESVRSAAGGLGSPFGVGLEKERIRLFVLPYEGDYFSLTSSDGLVTEAVYDDDPNVGGDTRMPLDFSKDDAVLNASVSSSGEAVIAWSIWKDGVTKNKALQAVRLELP